MPDFEIKILTSADLAGAKASLASLEGQIQATNTLGKSTDALVAKRDKLRENIVQAELAQITAQDAGTESMKAATHEVEHMELKHRELREAMVAVGTQFGGIGELALTAMGGPIAVLGVLIASIEVGKRAIEEFTGQVEKFNEAVAAVDDAKFKSLADSASKMVIDLAALADEQLKLNTAYARGNTLMDARIAQYGAQLDAEQKIQEAREKTFEADLDYAVEMKRISKEEADARKEAAQLQLDKNRGVNDEAKLQNEITEREKQLADAARRTKTGADKHAIEDTRQAQRQADSAAAGAHTEAEQFGKRGIETGTGEATFSVDELKKRIQEFKDAIQNNQELGASTAQFEGPLAKYESALKSFEGGQANLQAVAAQADAAAARAKALADGAVEQQKADQELLRSGADKIEQLKKQLELQKQVTAEIERQHAAQSAIHETTRRAQEANTVASGQGTPAQQRDIYGPRPLNTRDAADFAGLERQADSAMEAFDPRRHGLTRPTEGQLVDLIHRMMDFLQSHPRLNDNSQNELQSRITELERHFNDLQSQFHNSR